MVESSEKMWSSEEGNGKTLQHSWESHKQYKKAKNKTLKDELPKSVGAQYSTREEGNNRSKKNEKAKPKQKQHPVVNLFGSEIKSNAAKNNIV